MDVFTLQRLMGHADLATTRRYVALVDDDLRASHKRFGAVDGMLLRR
jgi:integrase/recombinase XerD